MTTKIQVNDLLFYARLPSRFLEAVTSETNVFKNPGNAVRSFVIAKCIQDDAVELPEAVRDSYLECKAFTLDAFIYEVIIEKLVEDSNKVLLEVAQYNPHDPKEFSYTKRISAEVGKHVDDLLALSADFAKGANYSDQTDLKLSKYRQLMFDLQVLIEELNNQINQPEKTIA
jgi:hypothetical protein